MADNVSANGNGQEAIPGLEGMDMGLLHRFMLTMNNNGSLLSRSAALKRLMDPRRDYDDEFGYPETHTLVAEDYRRLYERDSIAVRVVEVIPSECWNTEPEVWEDEDVEVETEFEEDWNALPKQLRLEESWFDGPEGNPVWEALARAHKLSRIGHFGVIVLGINDGLPLHEPIRGIEESGSIPSAPGNERGWVLADDPLRPWVGGVYNDQRDESYGKRMVLNNRHHYTPIDAANLVVNGKLPNWSLTVNEKKAAKNELTYLKVFDEAMVDIIQYEMNPLSPRYGYPTEYSVTFNNPFLNVAVKGGIGLPITSQRVHWSRIIHIVDDRDASDLFGTPAQRPVLNNLLNLHKVYGGDAEAYFRGCVVSHSLETHPQLGPDAKIDWDVVKDQYEQFSNSMSRIFGIAGASLKSHAPQITDPTSHINIQIEAICIKLSQPKRIFMGSERGELSSSQDSDYWTEQVKGYQKGHCIPHLIVPLVDRLILIRALRPPKDGYSAGWTEEDTMPPTEKAAVLAQRVAAMTQYVSGGVDTLMTPKDFLVREMEYEEEDADAILDAAEEHQAELEEEEAAQLEEQMANMPPPDPNAPPVDPNAPPNPFGKAPGASQGASAGGKPGNLPFGKKGSPRASKKVSVANAEEGVKKVKGAKKDGRKPKVKAAIEAARLVMNNCGTGKGGFKKGNSCGGKKGGRGGGGGGAVPQTPIVQDIEKDYPPANPDEVESHARHMKRGDPSNPQRGDFTDERAALHDSIIKEATKGIPPATGEKVYTMMGGGPASGKSSILNTGQVVIPNGVKGDSDELKTKLPEYNPLVKSGEAGAASYVHEESSYLVKQVAKTAFENGQNFTLDGTGNSSYNAVKGKVESAKAAGYRAEAVYVTCSTEEAVRRNLERAAETGRLPPEQMLRSTHANVSKVVPQALKEGIFDKFELYDTEVQTNGRPTLVVSARGKDVTIHNEELYKAFVKKGE